MASSVPRPLPLHRSAAAASSTHGAASAPAVAFTSALQANALRLEMIVQRLSMHFRSGVRTEEFSDLCFFLARGIDYALSYGDLPSIAHHLPSLIQQVYEQRKCAPLQSAILVLMISVKNACQNGWFHLPDINEILRMTNELCSNFCTAASVSIDPAKVIGTISEVIPRYYPQLKFCRPVVSFEAKPGYEILLADFQIPRNIPPEEKIALFVTQTDNLETSSCIISPPQVSILINGKALEKRSNVSLDHGPQFPTDITKMLKYGTNIIQALGYFSGNYIITIAFISKITSTSAPILKDYVPPVVSTDFDIIEGPSRISLNCPISLRRIKTPVKGFLCKHYQCFDYDNFLEMNSRKPSWRCPYCNQPTSYIDLRVDQNMIKILKTVGEDIADVVISADGSWEVMADHNGSSDQLQKGSIMALQHGKIESKSNRQSINLAHVVDLTMKQNGTGDAGVISGVVESLNDSSSQICEFTFDTKNTVENYKDFSASEFHSQEASHPIANDTQLRVSSSILKEPSFQNAPLGTNALGTLETLVPNCVLNPVMSNTTGINEAPTVNLGILQSSFSIEQGSQARQFAGNTQLQPLWLDNSVGSSLAQNVLIPTHVCREPMTVQTLPVEIQTSSSSQRPGSNVLSSSSIFSSGIPSRSYPMDPSRIAAIPDPFNVSNCNRDSDSSILQLHSTEQGFGLPTSNSLGLRGQVAQQGVPSNRASLPTSLNIQNYIQQFGYRTNQILNHSTSALPHIPSDLSMQCRTVSSACQLSPPVGSLLTGTAHLQASITAPSMTMAHNSLMIAVSDPLQCQVGSSYPFGTSHRLPELPAQPNWQPTGRMRGSLAGLAYSAALNHYSHPMQEVSMRPSTLLAFNEPSSLLNFSNTNTNTSGALP